MKARTRPFQFGGVYAGSPFPMTPASPKAKPTNNYRPASTSTSTKKSSHDSDYPGAGRYLVVVDGIGVEPSKTGKSQVLKVRVKFCPPFKKPLFKYLSITLEDLSGTTPENILKKQKRQYTEFLHATHPMIYNNHDPILGYKLWVTWEHNEKRELWPTKFEPEKIRR